MGDDRFIVTAHQANYLPYLGFFEKISVADRYILVDDTQFVKRGAFGWIHRNRILGPQGEPIWLTVPCKTHDRYDQLISDVEIVQQTPWRRKHLRSIESAYAKTPFFKDLFSQLQAIYQREWTHLVDISEHLILWVLDVLGIEIPVSRSSELELSQKSSNYVLELAQKSGASHYLSGTHGKDYLDLETFEKANMGLIFQNFTCHPYPQLKGKQSKQEGFISHLSTLDALFQIGPQGTRDLMARSGGYLNRS
jgi:hypothetical protein